MFGIWKERKPQVIQHWYVHVPDYQSSTSDFYRKVIDELEAREVPQLVVSRMNFYEGEFTTPKREYLRTRRERFMMDLCSSPFGKSWFFSCRIGVIPMKLRYWEILVLLVALFFVWSIFVGTFALGVGMMVFLANVIAAVLLLNTVAATGNEDLDSVLMKVPVVGAVYELMLRRNDSYYREDTRHMYVALVDGIIRHCVEQWLKADGIEGDDFEFVENPEPMSPRGFFDPMLDFFKSKLQAGLLKGIDIGKKALDKGIDKLTS